MIEHAAKEAMVGRGRIEARATTDRLLRAVGFDWPQIDAVRQVAEHKAAGAEQSAQDRQRHGGDMGDPADI
jgi:hypothetical protein